MSHDPTKPAKPVKPAPKLVKTRVRTDSEGQGDSSKSDALQWCPCGLYDRVIQKNNFEIECFDCKVWWHHKCVMLVWLG